MSDKMATKEHKGKAYHSFDEYLTKHPFPGVSIESIDGPDGDFGGDLASRFLKDLHHSLSRSVKKKEGNVAARHAKSSR